MPVPIRHIATGLLARLAAVTVTVTLTLGPSAMAQPAAPAAASASAAVSATSSTSAATTPPAKPAAPNPAELITQHSYRFGYDAKQLSGPGALFLRSQLHNVQFVLFGEEHMDYAIPIFASGLYHLLHQDFGFRHLVVEQDPLAMEQALLPERRGKLDALATFARRYPGLFEFDTDQDLALITSVGQLENRSDAIWGVEQATGAVFYLERLLALAKDATLRAEVQTVLDAARKADPPGQYSVNWLVSADAGRQIAQLTAQFAAQAGAGVGKGKAAGKTAGRAGLAGAAGVAAGEAARLLAGLAKSAEIFGYYRRAEAGEFVGLYNNTVREEVLKANFLLRYRQAQRGGGLPKAMFKFGSNHLYHGKNLTQAFPIGNLAHELAIVNGQQAYGLYVVRLGPNYAGYRDYPEWLRALLPAVEPGEPTLINLRALRPYQRVLREQVGVGEQWKLQALLHGYDAVVVLPGSKAGTRELGRSE